MLGERLFLEPLTLGILTEDEMVIVKSVIRIQEPRLKYYY